MRISIIACRVLNRELSGLAAKSANAIDIHWMPQGLHDVPDILRARVAATLEEIYRDLRDGRTKHRPDYIALGYGLCSNGVVGLESRNIPLVVPRTDDCIALFLGSQRRYLDLFEEMRGAYWLNNGWLETCGTLVDEDRLTRQRWQAYAEKFGEDNADYLIEQERQWMTHYDTCGYIRSEIFESPVHRALAQRIAGDHGWKFREFEGDLRMLRMLVDGAWNEEEFLIVPPCHRIAADYSGLKVRAEPIG